MKKNIITIMTTILIMFIFLEIPAAGDTIPPTTFLSMEDFRTFVETGSRNPEDYTKKVWALDYEENLSKEMFLDIEELFQLHESMMNMLEYIDYVGDGATAWYAFGFDNNIFIEVTAETGRSPRSFAELTQSEAVIDEAISLSEIRRSGIGVEHIVRITDNAVLSYEVHHIIEQNYVHEFNIEIGIFNIRVSVYGNFDAFMDDPLNAPISVFFADGMAREAALRNIVSHVPDSPRTVLQIGSGGIFFVGGIVIVVLVLPGVVWYFWKRKRQIGYENTEDKETE